MTSGLFKGLWGTLKRAGKFKRFYQIDQGKTASAARN